MTASLDRLHASTDPLACFKHDHATSRTLLLEHHGRVQTGDAGSDDDDVGVCFHVADAPGTVFNGPRVFTITALQDQWRGGGSCQHL